MAGYKDNTCRKTQRNEERKKQTTKEQNIKAYYTKEQK